MLSDDIDNMNELNLQDYQDKSKCLPIDDLELFFEEKLPNLSCPMCGGCHLSYPIVTKLQTHKDQSSSEVKDYVLSAHTITSLANNSSQPHKCDYQYRIICKHCAYEMAFNAGIIIDWLKGKNNIIMDNET